jgi:hypothetical protein
MDKIWWVSTLVSLPANLAGISTLVPEHNVEPKVRSGQVRSGQVRSGQVRSWELGITGRGWMDGGKWDRI